MSEGKAQGRYEALKTEREPFLRRARKASELTIPSLIPPDGWDGTSELYTPYQGIGARGVNHLSAKIMLAVMPPNEPFFRQAANEAVLAELEQEDPQLRADTEKKLGAYERRVMKEIEASGDRATVNEAKKHLVVGGNAMLDMTGIRTIMRPLSTYVVSRDAEGNILELVFTDVLSPASAPDVVRELLGTDLSGDDKTLTIYTHAERVGGFFNVYQEVKGKLIPGSEGKYKIDDLPYLPLRFNRIDGESYGRGFIEEMYGDLSSLEALSEALVQGSAAASKILFLVDPNGTTRVKTLRDTPNGGFGEGSMRDVSVLQLDKYADFRVAADTMRRIEERLSEQFLLHSSVQRNGERVTAEEIRFVASELEDALSGLYSILSLEFQLPYVRRKIKVLTKAKKIPSLPEGMVDTTIITGLEALGRGHDLRKLEMFIRGLQETFGPEQVAKVIDLRTYAARRATALGLETEGLIKDPETIQQDEMLDQLKQLATNAGPGAVQEMLKNGGSPQAAGPQEAG